MTQLQMLAPAKLNLFLHITGRREDGYHELQTVFQLLDFGDVMTFELTPAPGLSLHVHAPGSPQALPMDNNLVMRAARLLREHGKVSGAGTAVHIDKRIPAGAGLGGGSANAAITLVALNQLWQTGLGVDALCEIGLKLGADVPVFIRGNSAWAEGVGEQLVPVELPNRWYLVVTPPVTVSTAQIFCHEDLTRNTPAIKMADFLAGGVRNDCEAVTCRLYPEVAAARDWLSKFAETRMTGTGASVFAVFADEASAREVAQAVPAEWHGFVAQGVNSLAHSGSGI